MAVEVPFAPFGASVPGSLGGASGGTSKRMMRDRRAVELRFLLAREQAQDPAREAFERATELGEDPRALPPIALAADLLLELEWCRMVRTLLPIARLEQAIRDAHTAEEMARRVLRMLDERRPRSHHDTPPRVTMRHEVVRG